ncbi:MAG: photosynthetic complex assembly protein PuhC [Gemmatimonadales bacterium]|nr:MAG: photosynthetic complex assembly protein PuhC [Gemmatimonadales bacterium]
MSYIHIDDDTPPNILPPAALKAIGVMLALVLVLAAVARLTGVGVVSSADLDDRTVIAERMISFETEGEDGIIRIRDGSSAMLLVQLEPGEGGFLRGAVRPLNRERMTARFSPEDPYRLVQWSDGALTLDDPLTGVRLDLYAFGHTNAGAFAALLTDLGTTAPGVTRRPDAPTQGEHRE